MQNRDEYQNTARIYDFLFSRALKGLRTTINTCLAYNKATTVVDLCCGTGEQLRGLASQKIHLTGVDLSQAMLDQARKKSPGSIHYLESDASATQLPAGKYDGVIITFALHEKPAHQHQVIFEEACRLVHPEGHILIADYCMPPETLNSRLLSTAGIKSIERLAGINHYHSYQDWMAGGAIEGFLGRNIRGKLNIVSEHFKGCVKLIQVSNVNQTEKKI